MSVFMIGRILCVIENLGMPGSISMITYAPGYYEALSSNLTLLKIYISLSAIGQHRIVA